MSLLINALNNIFTWLEKNNPDVAASLQPGLTYSEIEDRVAPLPFRLPKELYELYQWRNGSAEENNRVEFFRYYRFIPLDEALNIISDLLQHDAWIIEELFPYGWFPIFTFEGEYYSVIGSEKQRDSSPIIHIYHDETVEYISLTAMMQTIAEYYTTEIYYLDKYDFCETKQEAENLVCLKYNSGVITSSHYYKRNTEIINKSNRLKITNIYSQDRNCIIVTRIEDYNNNLTKLIRYLGGKAITVQTSQRKYKSIYDSYCKEERFYCDRDTYESQTIAKRKGWFLWELTHIKRRYINNILKKETINTQFKKRFLCF